NEAKQQIIDPGLLQQGERDATEGRRTSVFSAKIFPIPAYGTKRVELEYEERLPVENLQSYFALPLKPDAYRAMTAARLSITFELTSAHALKDFKVLSKTFPMTVEQTATRVAGKWEGQKVSLAEDFNIQYTFDQAKANSLQVLAYRDSAAGAQPGFFEISALFAPAKAAAESPRTVIALFDNSLSMQWEKLERSYAAVEGLLRSLRPVDRFNLILFNTELSPLANAAQPATPEAIEKAMEFIRRSPLRGGTDLQRALAAALPQATGEGYIVMMTDGGATRGPDIRNSSISPWYAAARKKHPSARTYVFAVGDDANIRLLKQLGDVVEHVRSTEPIEFKLAGFLSKIGRKPLDNLSLITQPASNVQFVYPLEQGVFAGSIQAWVGQYLKPAKHPFSVQQWRTTAELPPSSTAHPHLPRAWAKARVDALLDKIDREGEDRATIDEIIRLSRKYKFVTPYTSFLAAPRSLLRPRVIRPGDPVLRVHTDPSIQSVVALFPFGLVKSLRFLNDEKVWQTRVLAPSDIPDGNHSVRLILRDNQGRVYRESKTFLIASKPPTVRIQLGKQQYRRGETVQVRAGASESSRTVIARMYGIGPVSLRWNETARTNTGSFVIPAHLPAGRYPLRVTAEDFAHNIGSQEVSLEILP
ncbi:MAG TPA: VWA domain-containing protein, partial [Bryobacteraceae bacterium]|nr:VWA domain-containing protein [Bryobacteraceae bacterium]